MSVLRFEPCGIKLCLELLINTGFLTSLSSHTVTSTVKNFCRAHTSWAVNLLNGH